VLKYFQQNLSQWLKVFNLSGAICLTSGMIYLFFGTSKIQDWNTYGNQESNEKEMKLINKKSENINNLKN